MVQFPSCREAAGLTAVAGEADEARAQQAGGAGAAAGAGAEGGRAARGSPGHTYHAGWTAAEVFRTIKFCDVSSIQK